MDPSAEQLSDSTEQFIKRATLARVFIDVGIFIIVVLIYISQQQYNARLTSAVHEIESGQLCIGSFFLQSNRTEITLANLPSTCSSVTNKIH